MKLTTKMGLVFLVVIVVVGGGLGIFGIPSLKRYLRSREINYSKSFLKREALNARIELVKLRNRVEKYALGKAETDKELREVFDQTSSIFDKFFAHETARFFVVDHEGAVWKSSDVTKRGKSVSNLWIYDDGKRDRLIREINLRRQMAEQILEFNIEEVEQGGRRTEKVLFVAVLPGEHFGHNFYVCISEDVDDIFHMSTLVSKSLVLLLALTILTFYVLFQFMYTRLRRRYDLLMEHADLIAQGNYSTLINDKTNDEIGMLARTIDTLANRLNVERDFAEHHVQGQKMEMIGTLASGIAHDFNNMLGSILSGLDLVNRELASPANGNSPDLEQIRDTVRLAHSCAERGRKTVGELLSFSRKRRTNVLTMDLNHVLGSVKEICKHSFDRRIRIETHPLDSPAVVEADRSLLEQALMNVCINARDAMKAEGGILRLSVDKVERENPMATDVRTEEFFCISIEDNGRGMDEETIKKVFEPFFTKKDQGTGLGLAMVYKTVDDLDGFIDIISEVGKGTTFKIHLLASEEELSPEQLLPSLADEERREETTLKGEGKVLVIDDDEFILQITEDILIRLGYTPIASPDGRKGVEAFRKNAADMAVVILDLMLPDIGGDEVFRQLRETDPNVKILLVSGFKRDPRIADMLIEGCNGFLKKPYSIEELSDALKNVLEQGNEVAT